MYLLYICEEAPSRMTVPCNGFSDGRIIIFHQTYAVVYWFAAIRETHPFLMEQEGTGNVFGPLNPSSLSIVEKHLGKSCSSMNLTCHKI